MGDAVLQFACATDRSYLEMTGVLIASICAHDHGAPVVIYGFCQGLKAADKARLRQCVHGGACLELVDIAGPGAEELATFVVTRHLSMTTYARIVIPDLIPTVTGRLLYLDCDIVVNRPLDALFGTDLVGKVSGAVRSPARPERLAALNRPLGRPDDMAYFNAGVMLIDLDAWRARGISERAMAFARTWDAANGNHDQAVLNVVLSDLWQELPSRWNANPSQYSQEEAETLPIQHFWGRRKPFFSDYPKAHRTAYDCYRALTPWATAHRLTPAERLAIRFAKGVKQALRGKRRRPSTIKGPLKGPGPQA